MRGGREEKKAKDYIQKKKEKFQTDVPKAAVWVSFHGWETMPFLPVIFIIGIDSEANDGKL